MSPFYFHTELALLARSILRLRDHTAARVNDHPEEFAQLTPAYPGPVTVYPRFQIGLRDHKVVAISQEAAPWPDCGATVLLRDIMSRSR